MADTWSQEQRRALMRRMRTTGTGPELRLRRALWARGARGWRTDVKGVFGRPDLAWRSKKVAVFVDGAFWHGHPDHYHGQSGPFWDKKIAANRARDKDVDAELKKAGWVVLRLWDFEIDAQLEHAVDRVVELLESRPIRTRT